MTELWSWNEMVSKLSLLYNCLLVESCVHLQWQLTGEIGPIILPVPANQLHVDMYCPGIELRTSVLMPTLAGTNTSYFTHYLLHYTTLHCVRAKDVLPINDLFNFESPV